MIASGKQFEYINEKIAALQLEILQAAKRGLTNLNKHCENFVKRILNITYGYRLENLNRGTAKFPGLDIGSKGDRIAFQISSEKTTSKVDETLQIVERQQHYLAFPSIRVFMLCGKQKTYSVDIPNPDHFTFDPKTDIVDFNDLLADIQNLETEKIKEVYEFVKSELDEQITVLQQKIRDTPVPTISMIDIKSGISHSGLRYFSHFSFVIRMRGQVVSMPQIYHGLETFFSRETRMGFMPVLLTGGGRPIIDSQTARYHDGLRHTGASNRFSETIFEIKENSFHYETVNFQDDELLLDNLAQAVFPLLCLILFCERLCGKDSLDLQIDIDLSTNGRLLFYNASSPLSVKGAMENYELNPSEVRYTRYVSDTRDDRLVALLEPLIHSFVNQAKGPFAGAPFYQIDIPQQIAVLNFLRTKFQIPLGEL